MNWKKLLLKVLKGAVSGVTATAGTMLLSGIPMTGHALSVMAGSALSAAIHGVTNVLEQNANPAA